MLVLLRLVVMLYVGIWFEYLVIGSESIPVIAIVAVVTAVGSEFLWNYLAAKRMMKKLSDLPPLSLINAELEGYQSKMTKWEQDFYLDIQEKIKAQPQYLSAKASSKQINILFQIYAERVRKVKLKGETYSLEIMDDETGEVREITNVTRD